MTSQAQPANQPEYPLEWPLYGATFGQAVRRYFKKYAVFSGRASRSEYWWVALFQLIVFTPFYVAFFASYVPVIMALSTTFGAAADDRDPRLVTPSFGAFVPMFIVMALMMMVSLAMIVPSIAITVRRLHDANYPGTYYLFSLIPYGSIAVLVFTLMPSKPEGARFDLVPPPMYAAPQGWQPQPPGWGQPQPGWGPPPAQQGWPQQQLPPQGWQQPPQGWQQPPQGWQQPPQG